VILTPYQDEECFVGIFMMVWNGGENRKHQTAEH